MAIGALRTMTLNGGSSRGARLKRHLLIISRHHPALYDYVRERFAGEPNLEVILDRRHGVERRARPGRTDVERRSVDRRRRPDVDAALRMESMQFLTIPLERVEPTEGSL
jgi:hypothetical protein